MFSPFLSPSKTSNNCRSPLPLPLCSKLSPCTSGETGAVVSPPHPLKGWGRGGETSSFSRDFQGETSGGKEAGEGKPKGGGETFRWCVATCPADRSPRSLFALWLNHYRNEGEPDAVAHDLARRTCRALYPEVSRGL